MALDAKRVEKRERLKVTITARRLESAKRASLGRLDNCNVERVYDRERQIRLLLGSAVSERGDWVG